MPLKNRPPSLTNTCFCDSVFHRYGLLYVAFESDYQLSGEIALMMRRAVLAVVLGVSSTMPVFQLIAAFLVCLVALVIQQVTAVSSNSSTMHS
jgi:hypothetical protein